MDRRAAHLQQSRRRQQEARAVEADGDRNNRLQQDRDHHRVRRMVDCQYSLFHQPAVHSKINKFHSGMTGLQVRTCITCMERFPGMTVKMTSAGTECIRCTKDEHSPKTFSSENNMVSNGGFPRGYQLI